jgi:hypothetical protein
VCGTMRVRCWVVVKELLLSSLASRSATKWSVFWVRANAKSDFGQSPLIILFVSQTQAPVPLLW